MAARPLIAIVDAIKIDLKQFTDDNRLNTLDGLIIDKLHDFRATLIREELTRQKYVDAKYYQKDDKIAVDCMQNSVTVAGILLKSKNTIWKAILPTLIENVNGKEVLYLGIDGFDRKFQSRTLQSFLSLKFSRWTDKETIYTVYGNTAIFKNLPTKGLKYLTGLFLYKYPTDAPGFTINSDYPVPSATKLQMLVKKDILATWNIQEDRINDAMDTIDVKQTETKPAEK